MKKAALWEALVGIVLLQKDLKDICTGQTGGSCNQGAALSHICLVMASLEFGERKHHIQSQAWFFQLLI